MTLKTTEPLAHESARAKRKKIELHVLHNFAPSCLNRDGTNTPKTAYFGGVSRARVSSQCYKRAMEDVDLFDTLMEEHGAVRTVRLIPELARRVDGRLDGEEPKEETKRLVAEIFKAGGIDQKPGSAEGQDKDTTKILLFVSRASMASMIELVQHNQDAWRKGKKEDKARIVGAMAEYFVQSVCTPKIALFGRMLEVKSSTPFGKLNRVDAACQVAHPISTHRVENELDYFSAIDDLLPDGDVGAGMLGYTSFNSACYYRYASLDYEQLRENLGSSADALADKTVHAFLRAFALAVPKAKQTTFASPTPPSLVLYVVREGGVPISLVNAFSQPIEPRYHNNDLIGGSIRTLGTYLKLMKDRLGYSNGVVSEALYHDRDYDTGDLASVKRQIGEFAQFIKRTPNSVDESEVSAGNAQYLPLSLDDVIHQTVTAVRGGEAEVGA